jgi:CheY-like chemotaxis protein
MADLHISLRQFQRDHRKAVMAVASILWRRWSDAQAGQDDDEADSELHDEVARLGLELERVALGDLIEAVLQPVRVLAQRNHVRVDVREATESVVVRVDLTLVKQALLSALNAIIAARPDRLSIRWHSVPDYGLIEVNLNPPLPPDRLEEARELMSRLQTASDLLRAQGSELRIISERGGEAPDGDEADNPARRPLAGLTLSLPRAMGSLVLVIDDNQRLLQLFERYLVSEGLRFQGASGAEEALAFLEHDQPAAIVMDVMMRDMDGWQLLQTLRAQPQTRTVPVVVCSVLDEPELAMALGAQGYLKKPVTYEEVITAVRQLLAGTKSV